MKIISIFILSLGFTHNILGQDCHSNFPWILPDDCGYAPIILWSFPECNNDEELIFEDNFDGDSIDLNKWSEPWLHCALDGAKLEFNSFNNVSISDGVCHIIAKKETVIRKAIDDASIHDSDLLSDGKPNLRSFDYTSAALFSQESFLYGKYEARFRIPTGAGLWPAFWIFGGIRNNEIDFFDGYRSNTSYSLGASYDFDGNGCTAHQGEACGSTVSNINPDLTNWHKITCINDWYVAVWLLDDKVVHTENRYKTISGFYLSCGDDIEIGSQYNMRKNLPLESMRIILNLQIGSETSPIGPVDASTTFPASFDIDYVRVWKRKVVLDDSITIMPNPSKGNVTINFKSNVSFEKNIAIFNVFGIEVAQFNSIYEISPTLDLSFLARGTYFLKIVSNEKVATRKIILL